MIDGQDPECADNCADTAGAEIYEARITPRRQELERFYHAGEDDERSRSPSNA